MKLLVLAAGLGSRFGGVKQLASLGPSGETLLEYNVYDALASGFDLIVFLIREEIEEDFRERVLSRLPPSLPVSLAFQSTDACIPERHRSRVAALGRTKPWGTGHALICAREALGEGSFAVINADDFYGRAGFRAVAGFLSGKKPGECCLAGYRLEGVVPPSGSVSRAICRLGDGGRLEGIVEHLKVQKRGATLWSVGGPLPGETELSPDLCASMNLWGLDSTVLPRAVALFDSFLQGLASGPGDLGEAALKAEFYLPSIFGALAAEGTPVIALPVSEEYFGLTNPGDIASAREKLAGRIGQGLYPDPLWAGYGAKEAGS
jgi:hypothetical protein